MKVAKFILTAALALMFSMLTQAKIFHLDSPEQEVVGETKTVKIEPGDTLESIARRYQVGYYDLLSANPEIDERIALLAWHDIVIPQQHIIPNVERVGIVINLPEMKLYHFLSEKEVMIVPIGIGREGWMTPTGDTEITMKIPHPNWTPTKHVREVAEKEGIKLPAVVPPGPDNPLGDYVFLLGWKSYLIHGTNRPDGVGKRSSAGCFRLYPEDIQLLYEHVKAGTPVKVLNSPVKIGWQGNQFYMQAFPNLNDYPHRLDKLGLVDQIHEEEKAYHLPISWTRIKHILDDSSGLPVVLAQSTKPHRHAKPKMHSSLGARMLTGQSWYGFDTIIPKKFLTSPLKQLA